MRPTTRRSDDADVIRARLRALLDDGPRGGWVPEDEDPEAEGGALGRAPAVSGANGGPADVREPADATDADRPPGLGRHRAPGQAVRWNPGRPGARSLWIAGLLAALLVIGGTWLDRPRVTPVGPTPAGDTTPGDGTTGDTAADPTAADPAAADAAATDTAATDAPVSGAQGRAAAETATPVVVAVVGLVGRPGLVTVPAGSRVADAVEAAGGLLPGTDPAAVNLAALVADGQQIAVGVPGASGDPPPAAGSAGGAGAGALVNLNTATAQDLDALPGIGPVLAQRIVAHRSAQGPFRSVDELDDVPGIGPATAAELAELVTV